MSFYQSEVAITSPGSQRWLTALRKITVWKKFDLQLMLKFDDYYQPYTGPELTDVEKHDMQLERHEKLRLLMTPESLAMRTAIDLPDDRGLNLLLLEEDA